LFEGYCFLKKFGKTTRCNRAAAGGQREIAEKVLKDMQPYYENPIVTEISALKIFYEAEDYHQDYYKINPNAGYCSAVISPKLARLRQMHGDKLKESSV
jgi:peptide-methionine (S)-S-oxide reductase